MRALREFIDDDAAFFDGNVSVYVYVSVFLLM